MQFMCKFLLAGLGISAMAIGLMFFLAGAQWTADFFTPLGWLVFDNVPPIVGFDAADIDSEFRFYSVFWIAYGSALLITAINWHQYFKFVPILAGLFFLGGIGRILSYLAYGMPHPLFQILWVIELTLPVLIMVCWLIVRGRIGANSEPGTSQ